MPPETPDFKMEEETKDMNEMKLNSTFTKEEVVSEDIKAES